MQQSTVNASGAWRSIWEYVSGSFMDAFDKVNLVACFLLVIILCSGLGVIVSFFLSTQSRLLSLNTYYPAIVATVAIDYFFNSDNKRYYLGYAIFVSVFEFLLFVLSVGLTVKSHQNWALFVAIIATIVSWIFWICDNDHNPLFDNEINPNNSGGGNNFSRPLSSAPDVKSKD